MIKKLWFVLLLIFICSIMSAQDMYGHVTGDDMSTNTVLASLFDNGSSISFSIPFDCEVELAIYNIKGQLIKKLRSGIMQQGDHSVIWDGNDENGKRAGSEMYFYQLAINSKIAAVNKCLLLK